jgi:hypothetical protein
MHPIENGKWFSTLSARNLQKILINWYFLPKCNGFWIGKLWTEEERVIFHCFFDFYISCINNHWESVLFSFLQNERKNPDFGSTRLIFFRFWQGF